MDYKLSSVTNDDYMHEALSLAKKGRGWVSPNPMVGALVVKDGKVIGRGWHQKYGGAHAEVFALSEAGSAARGATLYCTLEPCNHFGKTPPCTRAIADAGVSTVVIGALDPNPVAMGGVEALKAAGIQVISGVREAECEELNAPFIKRIRAGLPLVTLKWAMSMDGTIATKSGDSKWISSEASRRYAHQLRAEHDAVLIGIGTLLADAPLLNCRLDDTSIRQPRRVILDNSARTPLDAPIWSAENAGPVEIVCRPDAPKERIDRLRKKGAEIILAGSLRQTLKLLADAGVLSVLVEGGSRVHGSFIDEKLADRACIFIAPKILGGGLPVAGGNGPAKMADALQLEVTQTRTLGEDIMVYGRIRVDTPHKRTHE